MSAQSAAAQVVSRLIGFLGTSKLGIRISPLSTLPFATGLRRHCSAESRASAGVPSTVMDDRSELWVAQLGRLPPADGVPLQEEIRAPRQADEIPHTLLLLEHPPVYTRGRRTLPADLPMGEDW